MQPFNKQRFVVAVLMVSLSTSVYAMLAVRGEHPYDSGMKTIYHGEKNWHQYRIQVPDRIKTRKATVSVNASAPNLWICAVGVYKDRRGDWQSVADTKTTPGNIRGWNTVYLNVEVPENHIVRMVITLSNRYLRDSQIKYNMSTF